MFCFFTAPVASTTMSPLEVAQGTNDMLTLFNSLVVAARESTESNEELGKAIKELKATVELHAIQVEVLTENVRDLTNMSAAAALPNAQPKVSQASPSKSAPAPLVPMGSLPFVPSANTHNAPQFHIETSTKKEREAEEDRNLRKMRMSCEDRMERCKKAGARTRTTPVGRRPMKKFVPPTRRKILK